jgi:hypothetical protein
MELSEKQQIYIRIMEEILPYIRNLQSHSFWRRLLYGAYFAELEIVHNAGRCIARPEFTKADVYWLNSQARLYINQGRKDFPFYGTVCGLLNQLVRLVPPELRTELTWEEAEVKSAPIKGWATND